MRKEDDEDGYKKSPVMRDVDRTVGDYRKEGLDKAKHVLTAAKLQGGFGKDGLKEHWVAGTWVFRVAYEPPEDAMIQGLRLQPQRLNFTATSCDRGETLAGISTSRSAQLALTGYGARRLFFYAIWLPNVGSPENGLGGFDVKKYDSHNESEEVLLFYVPPESIKCCWGPISKHEVDIGAGRAAGIIALEAWWRFENVGFDYSGECSELEHAMEDAPEIHLKYRGHFQMDPHNARARRGALYLEQLDRQIEKENREKKIAEEVRRSRENEPIWPEKLDPAMKQALEKLLTTSLVMMRGETITVLNSEEAKREGLKFDNEDDRNAVVAFCDKQAIFRDEYTATTAGIKRVLRSLLGTKPVDKFLEETKEITNTRDIIQSLRTD